MANFDNKTDNDTKGLIAFQFLVATNSTATTVSRDTQDETRTTFTFNYDMRVTDILNTMTVTNIKVNESDDPGFAISDVVPASRIIGDLSEVAYDSEAQAKNIMIVRSFGVFNTKRYINVEFDFDYIENNATGGARIFLHQEITEVVTT